MDVATIGVGIAGLSNLSNVVRSITGALKESGKAEVISQVIELQMLVSELIEKNRALSEENRALREKLELKAVMRFTGTWIMRDGDSVPHCPHCWESDGKAIHLGPIYQSMGGEPARQCITCKRQYYCR